MDEAHGNGAHEFERFKLAVDSIKHITTLTTGTIVLLATFAERIPRPMVYKGDLTLAFISLFVCLVASVSFLWGSTVAPFGPTRVSRLGNDTEPTRKSLLKLDAVVIYFSFCMGIVFLGTFALHNI
jgi:hypothetical protein